MIRIILSVFGFIFLNSPMMSQNLVPNPSFEDFDQCPKNFFFYEKIIVPNWRNPNRGTPDYFNRCSKAHAGVPKNHMGYSETQNGNGYIGLVVADDPSEKDFREYIQTQFYRPLRTNELVCIKFYVRHASNSLFKINQIGAFISKKRVRSWSKHGLEYVPQIKSKEPFISDERWELICGVMKANGGEEYLTIGNFQEVQQIELERDTSHMDALRFSYYYLDNVSVTTIDSTSQCDCTYEPPKLDEKFKVVTDSTFAVGKPIVLPEITFAVNKAELSDNIKPFLDSLSNYLKVHDEYTLTIDGHTDSTGVESENKRLSQDRARAVMNYLANQGISLIRMKARGHGSQKPIAANQTEEGRAENRRVEILIEE